MAQYQYSAAAKRGTSGPLRRAWVPALLWLVVIGIESSSMGSSLETGRFLLPIARFFDPQITAAQFELVHGVLRKCGHFFGYGMLSLLMARAWWATIVLSRSAGRLPGWRLMARSWSGGVAAIALVSTISVAALDEWHQTFLPGRTGTLHDLALDTMAAVFVQLVLVAAGKRVAVSE